MDVKVSSRPSGVVVPNIVELKPQVGTFSEGLAAFQAARLRDALAALHGVKSPFAASLRARIFLRLGDLKKALDALAKDVAGAASERGEHGMLRGVALGRLGNSEAGHRELVDARVFSISSGDSTLEAEVEYYVAYAEFATGS
jgi:hypothetical protein